MKTVTDLGEIKKLARMFVHLDIQSTEYSPLIVKHPFTDSGMIAYRTDDGGIAQADITSDPAALKLWQEEKLRQIKEARTPHEISFMITKSYSLAFLKYAAPHLSSKDLSEMLADVWVRTESPNNDPNMSKNRLLSLFKKAQPQFLMDEEEYGAFHNESHHPHMHLMLYSTSQEKRGFIDKNGLDHLRHLFGTEMFKYELADIYDEQTKQRDLLNADAREEISALADKIRNGLADNGEFVMKFVTLAKRMQSVTGKKVYGYLPKSVKAMVNELVDLLEKDEDIDRIYELWYQAKCAVYATYTDNPPPRKPLSQEEAFKPIRNAMIKEADELGKILHTLDEEQKQTSGDAPEKSDDDKASKGGGASHTTCNTGSNTQATNTARAKSHSNYTTTRNGYIATSITRFGNSLSRIFCDRFDEQAKHAPMGVDSRLWREIEAKKKGQNDKVQ